MKKSVINSKHLDSYDYDPTSKTLHVTFKNGSVYRYDNVPQEELNSYDGKETMGTFFAQNIRNKYNSKKVKG